MLSTGTNQGAEIPTDLRFHYRAFEKVSLITGEKHPYGCSGMCFDTGGEETGKILEIRPKMKTHSVSDPI